MRRISVSILGISLLLLAACGGGQNFDPAVAAANTPALPTFTGIVPAFGDPAGGTAVTLTGTNFTPGSTVTFNGNAATGVVFVSSTTLTATTPAGVGTVDVEITTSWGPVTLGSAFTYGPTLTSVTPAMGPETGGTAITLGGTNFAAPATVTVGGNAATGIVVGSSTMITCTTPPGTGTVAVVVTTSGGSSTLAGSFTYIPPPTLTAVTPDRGTTAGMTPVTLTGTGFTANAAGVNIVTIGGAPALGTVTVNDTTITCMTPAGVAGAVDVVVTNANGTATLVGGFTYVVPVLYAADGRDGEAGMLYRIDPTTAAATPVGPIGYAITGLAFHPNGTLYAAESAQ
ncbi:MAG: IPT/TIG domain-containing protein, partial [Planctomycetota bacterium]